MLNMSNSFIKFPKRKIPFLFADIILIAFSVFTAFLLRFEGQIPSQYSTNILGMIFLTLIISLPFFYFFKLYFFSWAYVSTGELISLAKATIFSFFFVGAILFILKNHPIFLGFPRSTLFITFFLIFFFSGATRFLKRIYLQTLFSGKI